MPNTELQLFSGSTYTLDLNSWAPDGVRGADKVASRVVYALLTQQGSVPGRPTDGSPFTDLVAQYHSEYEVFTAFAAAEAAVLATVRAAESADEADSEKVGTVRLASVAVSGTGITLTLSVTAKDGSSPSAAVDFTVDL